MIEILSLEEQINQLPRARLRQINKLLGLPTGRNKVNSVNNLLEWVKRGYKTSV